MITDDSLKGSAARLWKLVEQRTKAGADTASIDHRIWDLFGQEWAIMFTDLSGFSGQVGKFGIIHFLEIIFGEKQILLPVVEAADGLLIKVEADSFMILFRTAAAAVSCGVQMQRVCQSHNARRAPEEQ